MKFSTVFVFLAAAVGNVFAAPAAANVEVARADASLQQRDVDTFEKRSALVGLSSHGVSTLAARRENSKVEVRALQARQLSNVIGDLQDLLDTLIDVGTGPLIPIINSLTALIGSALGLVFSVPGILPIILGSLFDALGALIAGNATAAIAALNAAIDALQLLLG